MKAHEYALLFPTMQKEEFRALVQDIKEHGLLEPIVLFDGKVLDGWHRYRACIKAGIKPRFEKHEGNGALPYVVSLNLKRRHLTSSQKAVLALELEKRYAKEIAAVAPRDPDHGGRFASRGGRAALRAGVEVGIDPATVNRAKRVAKEAPQLLKHITAGKMSVHEAEHQVRLAVAEKGAKKVYEANEIKKRQENDREVKDHLEAITGFAESLKTARRVAQYGKFSPEAKRFTKRRYEMIRDLISRVEEAFDA